MAGLTRLAPWFLLGLLFWIPGVYLEFPADPWQHYGRMNEWSWCRTVTDHSESIKSSYFLAYSLVGRISPPVRQIHWFDFYYTGCCLLLCWQYYRLARAVGLGERASVISVLIQALTFGNNIFGFYRYYGISSSIFAQLGAVALIRIALETAKGIGHGAKREKRETPARLALSRRVFRFSISAFRLTGRSLAPCALLLALCAFNHIQGLGIAGLGLAAVVIWRLIGWRRSMVFWIAAAAVALSVAAILWWPRHPALDAVYRPQGWLTAWYGFNLFSPSSPAFARILQILGFFGVLNLAAALLLLRRNHLAGWLTITPIFALCLPFVAIPFANALAARGQAEIMTFHRMFLTIPAGLAIVGLLARSTAIGVQVKPLQGSSILANSRARSAMIFQSLTVLLLCATVIPASEPFFNRFCNVILIPPRDLSMCHVIDASSTLNVNDVSSPYALDVGDVPRLSGSIGILTTPGIGYALQSTGKAWIPWARKWMTWPTVTSPSSTTSMILSNLRHVKPIQIDALPFWPIDALYTSYSQTGFLSRHWLPNEVALEHSAQTELFHPRAYVALERRPPQLWLEWEWIDGRDGTHYWGKGAGVALQSPTEDRGDMNAQGGFKTPIVNDQIILRPVLRTLDGNGWRVSMSVTGPDSSRRIFESKQHPRPLGGDNFIFSDFGIRLVRPGKYTMELVGDIVWPSQTYRVRYTLSVVGNNGAR